MSRHLRRGNLTGRVAWGLLSVALALCCAAPVWAVLAPEPAGRHSTLVVTPMVWDPGAGMLVPNPERDIRDDDFAQIMQGRLIQGGASNVLDAKFVFQQCFGGGMLDDLDAALADKVKWVGGAASRWDEPSVGQVSKAENDVRAAQGKRRYGAQYESGALPPRDFWTIALLNQLATPPADRPLLDSMDNATADDRVGPNAAPPFPRAERGQSVARNGGETIQLAEPAAESYHAVLWAGNPDSVRHFFDIEDMRAHLIGVWGHPDTNPNVSITVLFGNGRTAPDPTVAESNRTVPLPPEWNAQAATRANLVAAMAALPLSDKEQFFFFATDHGGKLIQIADPLPPPREVLPGNADVEFLDLFKGELAGMRRDPFNIPLLNLVYSGLLDADTVEVLFNNVLLGYLDPTLSDMAFAVPESLLLLSNEILVRNNGVTAMTILDKTFYTGGINNNPFHVIPEPAALALFGSGVVVLVVRMRRKPRG